jgi:hypothetical protein
VADLKQTLKVLEDLAYRKKFCQIEFFKPYPKQSKFFALGATKRERMFMYVLPLPLPWPRLRLCLVSPAWCAHACPCARTFARLHTPSLLAACYMFTRRCGAGALLTELRGRSPNGRIVRRRAAWLVGAHTHVTCRICLTRTSR